MICIISIAARLSGLAAAIATTWLFISGITPAGAFDVEFKSRQVRRDILALYDSRYEAAPAATRIHRMAEMPLNWMGLKLTYRDVNGPLPPADELETYRGIVSWLVEPMSDPVKYEQWLDEATKSGLRLAVLGDVAPRESGNADPIVLQIYERLGLKLTEQFVSVTDASAPVVRDETMIGFERPLDAALPPFQVLTPASSATRVHLALSVPGEGAAPQSAVVATSAGGGYVAEGFTIFYDAASDRARWILNPFQFFKAALGDDRFPVPDVTTLDGRRMYFSHIDGDGWNNISEIENYREAQTIAADVVRAEIIEPYPDLPVSVGLIAGDALPRLGGLASAGDSARRLYALPQVEVASHTYTHPFTWGFYEKYDRAKELAMVDNVLRPAPTLTERMRGFLYRVAGKGEADANGRYIAGSADLPRSYLKEPFDIDLEVREALRISESFAPKNKKAAIYLWSGDTEPFEAIIRATREAGVRNMNGGDTRFDAEYPSHFYVPPIARPVGSERQIYAGNSNENTYTNNWHGPFYGQITLKETLKTTDSPRRLKPFNLYYHMYSGEKPGALTALKNILDLARASPVVPVKASEYAAIADDFFGVALEEVGTRTWRILNRGALNTFRFDDAAGLQVDWGHAKGVLGANRHNDALYISLDPDVSDAVIALRGLSPPPEGGNSAGQSPYLIESRWQLRGLTPTADAACGFTVSGQGYGPGDMVWQVPAQQPYKVSAWRGSQQLAEQTSVADASGRLQVKLDANALEPVQLRFDCVAGGAP